MAGVLRCGEIVFGEGAVRALPKVVERFGRRVLVCTDRYLGTTDAFLETIAQLTEAGLAVEVYDAGSPEVPIAEIAEAGVIARDMAAECVVGFGGGSSMDLTKTASLFARFGTDVEAFYGEEQIPEAIVPVIAVPTTAGTGSEVSPVAVVHDDRRASKVGIASRRLIPSVALVDPVLTYDCPPTLTAHSGIDAFTHAVESFLARGDRFTPDGTLGVVFVGKNELADTLALRAISLIAASLPVTIKEPHNVEARRSAALGSLNAGLAFSSAGTAGAHALQYPLGSATKTAHGLGVGVLLPYVAASQFSARIAELAEIARAMGLVDGHAGATREVALVGLAGIGDLVDKAGLPAKISEIGVTEAQIPEFAREASGIARLVQNSADTLDVERLEQILRAAFVGDRTPVEAG